MRLCPYLLHSLSVINLRQRNLFSEKLKYRCSGEKGETQYKKMGKMKFCSGMIRLGMIRLGIIWNDKTH